MKKSLLILLALAIISACQTSQKEKEEKPLMDQVMDVHDAVMPKMGALMKTSKELLAKAKEIVPTDSAKAQELMFIAQEIDLANESMMDWMRHFDPEFEGTEEEVKDYLLKKKEGIDKVAKAMNDKLEAGKKALE